MVKRKIKNLRWLIAGLVFLNTVNNYVDRQTLSILAPKLTEELQIDDVGYGYIVQAFLVAYTGMHLIAGVVIDRWGVKIAYGAATAWWSIAAMLHAFANSALGLGIFRFLLGIGESFNFISAEKVAAEWYPPKERALLNGLANAAAVTGAIITPPLVVWLMLRWSWRVVFIATGSLGFFWLVAWIAFYHLPERHPRITGQELQWIRGSQTSSETAKPSSTESRLRWFDLLKFPQTWGLILARIFSDPVWWFYLFWLPKYLTESRGLTMAEMSMIVWIPYLASDVGSIAGGWCSGFMISRGWKVLEARKIVMLASVMVMPLGVAIVFTESSTVAIVLICAVLFAHMSWKTNLMTMTVDIFPRSVVASAAGILGMGSGLGGVLFSSVAGHIIKRYSYTPIFVIMGFLHPVAYLFVRWLVRGEAGKTNAVLDYSVR